MKNIAIRLYLILTLIRLCPSRKRSNLLDDSLKKYVVEDAPKKWFTYITIFLHKWLNKIYLHIVSSQSILKTKNSYDSKVEDSGISKQISFFLAIFPDRNCHFSNYVPVSCRGSGFSFWGRHKPSRRGIDNFIHLHFKKLPEN